VKDNHLFLVGFMGSGKSTVAALLAGRTGRPWVELDALIEEGAGQSIGELFAESGEEEFRKLEGLALATLNQAPPSIVATGGGTFLAVANRQRMRRSGKTAWLDVSLEQALLRVGDGAGRPLWQDDDPVAFRALFDRRRACYALADYRFSTTEKPPETVAIDVFDCFEGIFD
jgi:shikimate kinase